jgi:hypothetical protein
VLGAPAGTSSNGSVVPKFKAQIDAGGPFEGRGWRGFHHHESASVRVCAAWRVKARKQHREDTGKKDAVERSGAADRGDRRAEAAHLVEIGQAALISVPRPPAI